MHDKLFFVNNLKEEMQREKSHEMFVAQHSIMKPEIDLQSKLAKTI